jgi:ribonuclease H / adenosylcobalamin/alpha-ribazole phosphatase
VSSPQQRASVIVEADGGSRGNPGPAAYGALLRDAATGEVLAEAAETIGRASNNVAEYRGLIAGLELVAEHAPGAVVEVRMDSKLVVEQMAGRWKVKHPDMKPLALRAQRIAPPNVRWTWVPRAQNGAADRLVNAVLDGERAEGSRVVDERESSAANGAKATPLVGWRDHTETPATTILLLRHGVTASTEARLFSGSGGADPGLTQTGRAQAERAADWLARRHVASTLPGVGPVDVVVTSPLRRCRETAEVVATRLALPVAESVDLAEAAFGDWDGLTFAEVQRRWPDLLGKWLDDSSVAPPAGESHDAVARRASRAVAGLVSEHSGRTVLAVSHVTPIKAIVREALDAPAQILHRMQLAPASITALQWWPDGAAVLRTFSYEPE